MAKPKDTAYSLLGGQLISAQIFDQLVQELRLGRFAQAQRLPAEVDLAADYGVSRTVIRDALGELEQAGYLERVRGIGTVINHRVVQLKWRLDRKLEYYSMIEADGRQPHSDDLQLSRELARPDMAESLRLEPGAELLRISKRVLADDIPVIYSIDYLPMTLFGGAMPEHLDFHRPIFDIFRLDLGLEVTSTVANVKAVLGSPPVRQALRAGNEDALLMLDETSYTRLCVPIMRSFSYYTNYFDFALLRKKA